VKVRIQGTKRRVRIVTTPRRFEVRKSKVFGASLVELPREQIPPIPRLGPGAGRANPYTDKEIAAARKRRWNRLRNERQDKRAKQARRKRTTW